MSKSAKLIGPIASPWVTLVGRLLNSNRLLAYAERLDPSSLRPLFIRALAEDRLGSAASRFIVAAKLALACRNADKVISSNFSDSHAQLLQDIVALLGSNLRKGGYFVEVGVGDGTYLSNTLLLEKNYAWKGILIEPNRDSHSKIRASRKARLVTNAAYSTSGEQVVFASVPSSGELSGISSHVDDSRMTPDTSSYEVTTETLDDILSRENAPQDIDFISIDTEGSELEILKGLSLDRWRVGFFAVEHNYDEKKLKELCAMLEPRGYRQVLKNVSEFDAWFIHRSIEARFIS